MNYFTPAWHSGELDDEVVEKSIRDYKRHLARLLPSLPPEVQRLATRISLHDGLLWEALVDRGQARLRLTLRCGDLQVGYFDLELEYAGVSFSLGAIEALRRLSAARLHRPWLPYFGEALYDEVDAEDGLIVHRILFLRYNRVQAQARRRLFRQERQRIRQRKRRILSRGNTYQPLTVQFEQLQIRTTPRASRYDKEMQTIQL